MNEVWTIEPNTAIGPLRLGMTKAQCEAILGEAPDSFRRTPDSPELILAYDDLYLHVAINAGGHVVEVSAFQPRRVLLSGVQLLGRPLEEVARELSVCGMPTEQEDAGLYCKGSGVLLVEVDDTIDGVELRQEDN